MNVRNDVNEASETVRLEVSGSATMWLESNMTRDFGSRISKIM